MTLTDASNCGSATECRTSIWAARWNTTSGRCSLEDGVEIGVDDVGLDEVEAGLSAEMLEVGRATGGEVVEPDDGVPVGE